MVVGLSPAVVTKLPHSEKITIKKLGGQEHVAERGHWEGVSLSKGVHK